MLRVAVRPLAGQHEAEEAPEDHAHGPAEGIEEHDLDQAAGDDAAGGAEEAVTRRRPAAKYARTRASATPLP